MKFRTMLRFTRVAGLLVLALALAGCGANQAANQAPPEDSSQGALEGVPLPDAPHPVATIEIEGLGTITAELYPEVAPNTVNNFISLANSGFYDGTIFHRVIPGFMIQGGDPGGTGTGGPGYSIPGEFTDNGFTNNLPHTPGVLSMARSKSPDSAGSQFFVMTGDAAHLNGLYAAFGQVTAGQEVADAISALSRDSNDRPGEPPVITSIKVDTLGTAYPEPEKTP